MTSRSFPKWVQRTQLTFREHGTNEWIASSGTTWTPRVLVTLETRESDTRCICQRMVNCVSASSRRFSPCGLSADQLLFEAPTMELQSYFIRRIGTNVNLGNIAANDTSALETIRLGLRSETLHSFEPSEMTSRSDFAHEREPRRLSPRHPGYDLDEPSGST